MNKQIALPVLALTAAGVLGVAVWHARSGSSQPASTGPEGMPAGAPSPSTTSPGAATAPSSPGTAATVLAGDSADAALLAELYTLLGVETAVEATAVWSANEPAEQATVECMQAAGFQYTPQGGATDIARLPWYAMSPEEYAATYGLGYGEHAVILGLAPQLTVPPDDYLLSLSRAERDAYDAAWASCGSAADPDAMRRASAANVAREQFLAEILADERVVTATAEWSQCMAAAGYDFADWQEMYEHFSEPFTYGGSRAEQEAAFERERVAAVANVPCEAAYDATYRDVIATRLADYVDLYESAYASRAVPEANG